MDIHQFLCNDYFLLTLTFGVYFLAKLVRKVFRLSLFNPILVSIAFLIVFLRLADIDYEVYRVSGSKIDFWLKPAVVALGVPLYKELNSIRKDLFPIFMSQLVGVGGGHRSCDGCFHRGGTFVGCQIGHHTYSHGGDQKCGRHTGSYCHDSGICGNLWCHHGIPYPSVWSHRQALFAGNLYWYGISCCGHLGSDGEKYGAWCLCFTGPYAQRNIHGHTGSLCVTPDGIYVMG